MKVPNKEEILESIKKRDVLDEIDSFMLGLDAPLEREIMRYVWRNGNIVNHQALILYFVYRNGYCSKNLLDKRLENLVKFDFLKRHEYRGTIFYEVVQTTNEV